jgi:hypothetical protein
MCTCYVLQRNGCHPGLRSTLGLVIVPQGIRHHTERHPNLCRIKHRWWRRHAVTRINLMGETRFAMMRVRKAVVDKAGSRP